MDYYCSRFRLDVPMDPFDGKDIAGMVLGGQWGQVQEHNRCDLVKTRMLAERLGVLDALVRPAPRKMTNLDLVEGAF
jgi:hypothetical protein